MKNFISIIVIFLSNQSFSQNQDLLELKYQFLDSTLQKQIILKNPNSISNKERKQIYHYVEYYVGKDQIIKGNVSFYYAAGKEPIWFKVDREYKTNKTGRLKFKIPNKRYGTLRSFGKIVSVSSENFDITNIKNDGIWEKFHPDGSLMSKYEMKNGFFVDGVVKLNQKNGKTILNTYVDDNLVKQILLRKNTKYINNSIVSSINDKTIFTYTKGKISDGYHYVYDIETDKKIRRLETRSGQVIKSVLLDDDGYEVLSKFDENSVRNYFDSKKSINKYEGIYRYTNSNTSSQYKFAIIKSGYEFKGHIIEASCIGCQNWTIGDVKFTMNQGAVDDIFDVSWKFPKTEKRRDSKFILTGKYNGGIISSSDISLMKLYPKIKSKKEKKSSSVEWAGNGSGIIISKSGYIVTNYHVIEDADDIEVEFLINSELKKFNAEIVQVDKINDLAIIKIFDMDFDGLDTLPYNFNTRTSDVGTKVYAYGYPMALSLMGKEIKVTDGIISAKTGFDGNVTTYQITAPLQGGNSGGPLFDDKGNFLGINSSGLKKDIADNVGYTIKSSYVLNLLDILPKTIDLPSNTKLESLPLTEQIKEISKYVVLVKVK